MIEITLEKSIEQAEIIKRVQEAMKEFDVEYLEAAYEKMKENHSHRESAMILDPNPHTALQRSDLEAIKLKQMRYYLDAAKNLNNIIKAEVDLALAKRQSETIGKMFGL